MKTYTLLRVKGGKLYPLFVERCRELPLGEWLEAGMGELVDENHVKSRHGGTGGRKPCEKFTGSLGPSARLALLHCLFTDWIGKRQGKELVQRKATVWYECEVEGEEQTVTNRNGLRSIPDGFYFFRTKPHQPFPWIISNSIKINRILSHEEVEEICSDHGVKAQTNEKPRHRKKNHRI